jgi:hypothetical protein
MFGDPTGIVASGAYGGGNPFAAIDPGPGNGGGVSRGGGGGGSVGWGDTNLGFQAGLDEKKREADLQHQLGMAGEAGKQNRFNSVFGYLSSLGNSLMGQGPFGQALTAGGGQVGQQPRIDAGPVWNAQQVQRQVNSARASNDATTASNMRQNRESLAGRGFGGNSPVAAALDSQTRAANLAANADSDRQIRWNAAQGNAQQTLQGQGARENQFASRQQEDIARKTPYVQGYFGQRNALLSALAGLA